MMFQKKRRLKNEFLHCTANGELENVKDSIKNRNVANLWDRNSISVNTIMIVFMMFISCKKPSTQLWSIAKRTIKHEKRRFSSREIAKLAQYECGNSLERNP